uniref:Uncharacterized protein n=1 Tax=Anguilla anguilla TaxID=7936 RepID=A0A0E9WAC6_ANGAN
MTGKSQVCSIWVGSETGILKGKWIVCIFGLTRFYLPNCCY